MQELLSVRRVALLGGLYSNYLALDAAIADARARGAEAIACLGDLGGFGPYPWGGSRDTLPRIQFRCADRGGHRRARRILLLGLLALLVAGAGDAPEDLFRKLAVEQFTPPRPAHDFALPTPEGAVVRLSDFRGKVVFLNFWASWCPACREEMPSMERLYREFKDRGFVILAVDLQEGRETVAAFVKQLGLTFPALLDEDGTASGRYRVRFIPTTYLVGKDGGLLGREVGPKDWASLPARQLIASLLARGLLAALAPAQATAPPPVDPDIEGFLARHWRSPIPPQGKPPARFAPLEASLDPKSCGVCHPAQYADWQTSLHAGSMGPGVMGQLVDMMRSDPETALECQRCHSPLSEQQRVGRNREGQGVFVANPAFDSALQGKGLVCAACHVRKWERFGAPRRDGGPESALPREQLPHHGATRTPAFLKSEFCQSCHQFPEEDGFALNGKLLENTYEEWKASPYARQGVQCQDCHMPDRRHLWRGIHDPEMVKRGVTIDLKTARNRGGVEATLSLTNSGTGHYFPTYLTPKVFLRMDIVDAQGRQLKGSAREAVVGRDATLDLSRELYDTRVMPTASFAMREAWKVNRPGLKLRARVVVEPDHFYTKFFRATIPQAERGKTHLQEALRRTQHSSFTIFSREVPL